jgi:cellulose synthase operon protein B
LQLPLTPARPFTIRSLSIGEYPTPFTRSPSLSTLAIVLSASDPIGWETALRVVGDLGSRATGSLLYLTAAYADNISDTIRQERDLLVIGRPSTLPIIAEMNDDLAAPFEPGSDRAINRRTQVVFRTGADLEEGYLELLRAPWNNQRVVLSILGTSEQSISWAAQALTNPDLRSRLGGSFALIVDDQVFIGGTLPTIATQPTDTAGASGQPSTITETVEIGTQFPDARPPSGTASLLVPLVISMGAMLLVVGGVIGAMWLRRRKGSKP